MSELDWSPIHPDHRDRLKALYEGSGSLDQSMINGLAVSFPADGVRSVSHGGSYVIETPVTFDSLAAATSERAVARARLADADERFRLELRAAYRHGATAAQLSEVVGLSLQRVHQLVAGARK